MIKAANVRERRTVVIASSLDLDFLSIAATLFDEGFKLEIAQDEYHLGDLVLNPQCAVAFVDDDFCAYSLTTIRKFAPHSRSKWVYCLRGASSGAQNQMALRSGVSLILDRPTSSYQYLIRTKQLVGVDAAGMVLRSDKQHGQRELVAASGQRELVAASGQCELVAPSGQRELVAPSGQRRSELPPVFDTSDFPAVGVERRALSARTASSDRWLHLFGKLIDVNQKDLAEIERQAQRTLSTLAALSHNSLITVHSFRPSTPLDDTQSRVKCLLSSGSAVVRGAVELANDYPELRWAAASGEIVFVRNKNAVQAYAKCARKQGEKGLIAIPLRNDKGRVVGAIRISSPSALDANMKSFGVDVAAFAGHLMECFSRLDFFSRIYNPDCNFYESLAA